MEIVDYSKMTVKELDKEAERTMSELISYENTSHRNWLPLKAIIQSTRWQQLHEKMNTLRAALPKDLYKKHGNPLIEEILTHITA